MAARHQRRTRENAIQLAILLWASLIFYFSPVQALPPGFVSETIERTTEAVTKGVFCPNLRRSDRRPMMLVASKEGRVRVLENPENLSEDDDESYTNLSDVILDLSTSICDNGQRGLHSMAVHPNFLETRWVYLYYTRWREGCEEDPLLGPQNVLARYTMNADTLELQDEQILLRTGFLPERIRNGGAMAFGTDGYLYLATGDAGVRDNAQNLQNLHGKLLRLQDDGGIPQDNPYAGFRCGTANGAVPEHVTYFRPNIFCSEIYSWGFRNPVHMALNTEESDANTALFAISDVGADQFEEVSWAGTDFRAKNYGWPEKEGPCSFHNSSSTAQPYDCPLPLSESNLVDPFHYYAHANSENGGRVGGSAFVPNGIWPSEYQQLFLDLDLQTIYNLVEDPDTECREACFPPSSGFTNAAFYESTQEDVDSTNDTRVVAMFFGPYRRTQALYVIQNGSENSIIRIRYTGLAPVAVIGIGNKMQHEENNTAQRPFLVGDVVWFDGSKSFDPDGGELIFQWDFGDSYDSTTNTSNPSHVYKEPGEYTVILVVTNSNNQAHLAATKVVVGKSPTAVMLSPIEGDHFTVGEKLHLNAEAYDSQGNSIADDQMTWSVRQYHSDGFDFILDETSGNDFELDPVPEPGDFVSAETNFLRVILFVIDDNGLITKVVTDLYPNVVTVNLATDPEGLKINMGDNEVATPTQIQSFANIDLPVQITSEQPPYRFQQWSDGNTNPSRDILVPSLKSNSNGMTQTNTSIVTVEAIFCLVDNSPCRYANTTCCSGYCDEGGFCHNENQESTVSISRPDETDVKSRPFSTAEESEPVRKPNIPNATNFIEDDIAMSLASSNNKLDEERKEKEDKYAHGMTASWKWFICMSMAFLLISLFYFGMKYFRLKRKYETVPNNSSLPQFHDKSMPLKSVQVTPDEKENASTGVDDSDETNVSSASITSNASLSSASISVNKSSAIWDRIAEETERRAKLRAKYSSETAVESQTPTTPETMETRESPSNLDADTSPSNAITTNIDETLVRLDDLLAKCFTRKLARSCRKADRNNDSLEEGTCRTNNSESEVSNADLINRSENNGLAPIWRSSNQKPTPGSPLREKNDDSFVQATFSMSSLYSAGSFQDVSNESHALHLPEVSNSTSQSLLIFQDADLSMSNKESSINESDVHESVMESGIAGDGDRTTSGDLANFDERYLLIGNVDDIAVDQERTANSDFASFDEHLLVIRNGDDIANDGDKTTKSDLSTTFSNEHHLLMGNVDNLLEGNEDGTTKSDLSASSNERDVPIGNVDDLSGDRDRTSNSSLASSSSYERDVPMGTVDDLLAGNDDRTKKTTSATSSNECNMPMGNVDDDLSGDGDRDRTSSSSLAIDFNERDVLVGNVEDHAEVGDRTTKIDLASFNERQLLIQRVNDLISTWADTDEGHSQ